MCDSMKGILPSEEACMRPWRPGFLLEFCHVDTDGFTVHVDLSSALPEIGLKITTNKYLSMWP